MWVSMPKGANGRLCQGSVFFDEKERSTGVVEVVL